MFEFWYEKFETKLKNIDFCFLRGEYKLNIYSRYALISMQYHLSVHDLHTNYTPYSAGQPGQEISEEVAAHSISRCLRYCNIPSVPPQYQNSFSVISGGPGRQFHGNEDKGRQCSQPRTGQQTTEGISLDNKIFHNCILSENNGRNNGHGQILHSNIWKHFWPFIF